MFHMIQSRVMDLASMETCGRKAKPRVLEFRPEQRFVLKQRKWIMDAHLLRLPADNCFDEHLCCAHERERKAVRILI